MPDARDNSLMDEQIQRARVVQAAREWLGTPYHHRGAIRGVGTDCGMSLIKVFAQAGVIQEFDPGPYPMDWMLHQGEERYLGIVERFAKPTDKPKPGDIALFKFGRCISHGGIIVGWPEIVHAYKEAGCMVLDNVDANPRLKSHLVGFWSCWGN